MGSQNNSNKEDVQTCYPGFAYNFDPVTQLCEVQMAIEHIFVGVDEPYKLAVPDRIKRVQVQFAQGGGFAVTHPVPDGTPVLIHFATRGISHFKNRGATEAGFINGNPAPQFTQKFSFNNATCTVGNQPITTAIKDFNNEALELRNTDRSQRVSLLPSGSIEVVTGGVTINVTKDGQASIVTKSLNVKADNMTFDGKATFTKDVDIAGEATVKGKAVSTHLHTNPEGGLVGPMQ